MTTTFEDDRLHYFATLVGRTVADAGRLAAIKPDASDTSVLIAMQTALTAHISAPVLPNLRDQDADSSPLARSQ